MKRDAKAKKRRSKTAGRVGSWFVLATTLLLGLTSGRAEPTNAPPRLSFDTFRVISDRNIFNPNRYARSSGRTRTDSRPASRVESFTLVGLMAYEKGVFAFFDGTSPSYRKTLESDGTISEFKITGLSPDQVKLVSGTNEFTLHVGMQVRREDEGDWFLTETGQTTRNRVVVSHGRSRSASPGADLKEGTMENGTNAEPEIIVVEPESTEGADANGEATPAAENTNPDNGVTDPTLLRLMQRRQELNR